MFVYIIYSPSLNQYYVGISSNPKRRIGQHRKEKTHWTSRASDWTHVWNKKLDSNVEARELEKKIKSRGAKRFLQEVGVPPPAG